MSQHEFWQLVEQSGLMNAQQVAFLRNRFGQTKGAERASARTMAEWLISERNLSRFQADMLLARKPGPFTFGEYTVYDKITAGRLSGLLRAVHGSTQHTVCLQFLAGQYAQDPMRLATVAHQAAIYNGLTNRHLVRTYHFADLHSHRFMVVENLYGQSLADRLGERGALPPAEACRLAWHIAMGLARLEEAKLTHSELHPSNVWIDQQEVAKLIGFPLHRNPLNEPEPLDLNRSNDPNSRISRLVNYLAPEVPRGGQLTNRAEVYSLGCLLYEMLCGRPPFAGQPTFQTVQRHLGEPVVPPNQINPQVPGPVAQLVLYMLAKDPTQRYQKAAHVAEALKPYIEPGKLSVPEPQATPQRHNYENWLAQHHPAGGVDPDTGEFRTSGSGDFMRNLARASMSPGYDTPDAARSTGPTPSPQAMNQAESSPQIMFQTEEPSALSVVRGRKAADKPSPAGEEKKDQQLVQYMVVGIGTLVALLLVVIVLNQFSAPATTTTVQNDTSATTTTPDASTEPQAPDNQVARVEPSEPRPRPRPSTPSTSRRSPSGDQPAPQPAGGDQYAVMYQPDAPLWAWPVSGQKEPLDLRGLPDSTEAVISLRPADLLATPEGERVWAALGPIGGRLRATIEGLAGTPLENLDQVHLGFLENGIDPPIPTLVARPKSPVVQSVLTAAWGNPSEDSVDGQAIFKGNGRAYYVTNRDGRQLIAVSPEDFASNIVSSEPPLMRSQITQLAGKSDARLHVNILFAPSFVLNSAGPHVMSGPTLRVKDFVDEAMKIDHIKPALAGLVCFHLTDQMFFSELRLHPGNELPGATYSRQLYDLLETAPQRVLQFMQPVSDSQFGFVPTEANRAILARYPRMLALWTAYMRRGSDDRVAIVSSVLPTKAAHNLAMATQLAARDPGVDLGSGPVTQAPRTLAQKLTGLKFSSFTVNDELQRIVVQLGEEHEFKVQVMGADLQMEGITQNQRVILDLKESKTLAELLEQIVFVANPDKTVEELSDPNQKLVYVVGSDNETVIITTRDRAKERGNPPPVFGID